MSQPRSARFFLLLAFACLILSGSAFAQSQPIITADITASEYSSRPDLGEWEYTISVTWDTGTGRHLAYFDIMLDEIARACSSANIQDGIVPGDTVGLSEIDIRSEVYYYSEFLFQGDSLVPVDGQMLKIAPFPNQNIIPGPTGTGEFRIFSDYGPAPFEYPGLFMVDVAGQYAGVGNMMGFFPALTCDPVATEKHDWGHIKALYGPR